MRSLFLASLMLLAACRQEQVTQANDSAQPAALGENTTLIFAGGGRDRLCLAEQAGRAGLITYGEGNTNCSVSGDLQRSGDRLAITPDGDSSCRIEATLAGNRLTLGEASPACAYYCGPTASYAGKQMVRTDDRQTVTDLVGDPLC